MFAWLLTRTFFERCSGRLTLPEKTPRTDSGAERKCLPCQREHLHGDFTRGAASFLYLASLLQGVALFHSDFAV